MKHIAIIIISLFILQGCFTAMAGFNAGGSNNNIFNRIANANKPEKTEEKLHDAQNKELRGCLPGEYQVKCEKEMFLKKCDVSLVQEANLYLTCDADGENNVYRFYAKGTYKDGEQFEKLLNVVQSKRQ